MLTKEILDEFSKEANQWRSQFCVRKNSNNNYIKYEKIFKLNIVDGLYPSNEAIENSGKYKNFWDIAIPSIQHWWILCIARLTDPPYFKNNKEKANLSIYYILEHIDNQILKENIIIKLEKHQLFISSIKNIRDKILAHNNIWENNKTINKWIEPFFEEINKIIKDIKMEYPHLKDCNDLNLNHTEKLSETGVNEIFEKII